MVREGVRDGKGRVRDEVTVRDGKREYGRAREGTHNSGVDEIQIEVHLVLADQHLGQV